MPPTMPLCIQNDQYIEYDVYDEDLTMKPLEPCKTL